MFSNQFIARQINLLLVEARYSLFSGLTPRPAAINANRWIRLLAWQHEQEPSKNVV
jgi:hypothetical protein